MKNPFVIYNRTTGTKTIKKWPVYSLMGLLFLLCLLLIFSLPSGVKAELQEPLPTLPPASDGKNFKGKMDLYNDQKTGRLPSFGSRLDYLFSEDTDSILDSFDDETPLIKDEYPDKVEEFNEDDSWSRSQKAQENLRVTLENFAFQDGNHASSRDGVRTGETDVKSEDFVALENLLKERTDYLERLINSLEKQHNVEGNSSVNVNISDHSGSSPQSDPSNSASSDASVKAVSLPSGVVSGLGIDDFSGDESARVIPVQTPESQKIYVGELLEVRLLSDMAMPDGTKIEKGTRLFATTSLSGDRLMASFENVSKDGRLYSLNLEAYSPRDGLKGIEIENALKDNAVSDITSRLASSSSSSAIRFITNASSALGSVAEDGLRSVIQGGASYVSRKAQRKRVVIPSHLELYLK